MRGVLSVAAVLAALFFPSLPQADTVLMEVELRQEGPPAEVRGVASRAVGYVRQEDERLAVTLLISRAASGSETMRTGISLVDGQRFSIGFSDNGRPADERIELRRVGETVRLRAVRLDDEAPSAQGTEEPAEPSAAAPRPGGEISRAAPPSLAPPVLHAAAPGGLPPVRFE